MYGCKLSLVLREGWSAPFFCFFVRGTRDGLSAKILSVQSLLDFLHDNRAQNIVVPYNLADKYPTPFWGTRHISVYEVYHYFIHLRHQRDIFSLSAYTEVKS